MKKTDELIHISSVINIPVEHLEYIKIRRNNTHIIRNRVSGNYIRFGDTSAIRKELDEHKKLVDLGFPVASILEEATKDANSWYIEENLGDEPFGNILKNAQGTNEFQIHLDSLVWIASKYFQAQKSTRKGDSSIEETFIGYQISNLIDNLEKEQHPNLTLAKKLAERLKQILPDTPSEFTHGDFNVFNILEKGAIDFEDSFVGPVGGDVIALIAHPFMSPTVGGELSRPFPPSKVYFEAIEHTYGESLEDVFDTAFILKLFWWCYSNADRPVLQAYRWDHFERYGKAFLEGKSLYTLYREEYGIN